MTYSPSPQDVERMIERLRKRRQVYAGRGDFRDELINPDGPAAADLLAALSAPVAQPETTGQ